MHASDNIPLEWIHFDGVFKPYAVNLNLAHSFLVCRVTSEPGVELVSRRQPKTPGGFSFYPTKPHGEQHGAHTG